MQQRRAPAEDEIDVFDTDTAFHRRIAQVQHLRGMGRDEQVTAPSRWVVGRVEVMIRAA